MWRWSSRLWWKTGKWWMGHQIALERRYRQWVPDCWTTCLGPLLALWGGFSEYPEGEYGSRHRWCCTSVQSAETLEELEQCILVSEQEPCGLEEPSISDCEVVSDGDDERYDTVGPLLAARAVIQQKVKREQPMAQGGHPQGPPLRLSSPRIDHILRRNWSTQVRSFSKCTGNPWQHGFCNFGMQGWAQHLWRFLYVLTERNRGMECKIPFWKCKDPQRGPELAGVPPGWCGCACGWICAEVYRKGCVLRFRKV